MRNVKKSSIVFLVTCVAGAAIPVACTSGESGRTPAAPAPSTVGSSTSTGRNDGRRTALSRYESVSELAAALREAGVPCRLEYEGLRDAGREVSICVVGDEQLLLTVWSEPGLLRDFLASPAASQPTVAVGENWSVDADTQQTAARIAEAAGGAMAAELSSQIGGQRSAG
ncbi:MAG: hypothetical protein KatS3mg008_0203 [Acidimicrobiales bacterium]|nr:MAG: hypothetical protein KatS3mg008_0203 [Acidimicrobiales bacterium]